MINRSVPCSYPPCDGDAPADLCTTHFLQTLKKRLRVC